MGMNNFDYKGRDEQIADRTLPFNTADGRHWCKVVKVEKKPLRTGFYGDVPQSLVITLGVSGSKGVHYNHTIYDGDQYNGRLSAFLDSFSISSINGGQYGTWIGALGVAEFEHYRAGKDTKCGIKKLIYPQEWTETEKAQYAKAINPQGWETSTAQAGQAQQAQAQTEKQPPLKTAVHTEVSEGGFPEDIPF